MALFRRRNEEEPPEDTGPQLSANGFNPVEARDELFVALEKRIGVEYAAMVRRDFDEHITTDPVNGVEAAYYCLSGKLIDYVDALNIISGRTPTTPKDSTAPTTNTDGPEDFTVFRKTG